MSKTDLMRIIKEEVLNLKNSPLYEYRTSNNYFPVIGEWSLDSRIMLVGEAPGRNEAKTGRPFCGAAGKILNELLASVKIKREDVYITNIVKDRPQENRDPTPEEIEIYGPFLDRQIEIIKPKAVVALGRYAYGYLMKKFGLDSQIEPISRAHGKSYSAKASYGKISVVALYHPCAAIYSREKLPLLLEDFRVLEKFK